MKLGILTYHFVANYGAVFQAYALKSYLAKLGHDVEIIDYRPLSMTNSWDIDTYKKYYRESCILGNENSIFKSLIKYFFSYCRYIIFYTFTLPLIKKKYAKFNDFVYRYLCKKGKIINNPEDFVKFNNYDVIFYGSDQIWNPDITHGFDPVYFACYTHRNQCKVAYSASIGNISLLSTDAKISKEFIEKLQNFDLISVREKNLAEYIRNNGKKAEYIADPTFLLSSEDYKFIADDTPEIHKDYILVYHLRYDKTIDLLAKKIAALHNWNTIIVNGSFHGGHKVIKDMGPSKFMGILKNAKCVITNSFHGTALSIIFNINFYVVLPEIRQDRLLNLLHEYHLENRIVNLNQQNLLQEIIDYEQVNRMISEQRKHAINFISSILSSC